jgi:hypothetical protein
MFETIVKYAAGITAIVAVGAFLVTNIRSFIEYSRQNSLKRFEKYTELAGNWAEDKNIQMIIKLLDEGPPHKLRTLPFENKRAFLEFYEDIAIMRYSGLMKKRIAYYMFGFYTIRCNESHDFWFNLEEEKEKHWWSLFRRFAAEMKQIEQDISLGRENPEKWKFKF